MPLINGAACLPNSLCCMSASGPSQLGSPPKKSQMNHVVFLFVGSFFSHDTWYVWTMTVPLFETSGRCYNSWMPNWKVAPWGNWSLNFPTWPLGGISLPKPTEPKATGSIKLKVQYEAIGNPPCCLNFGEKFWEKAGSSSTMFKCILGRFQCKKLSNILSGHGQDLRMAIGARFCANRSNNFQHCPCKNTTWKSLKTYLLSRVW